MKQTLGSCKTKRTPIKCIVTFYCLTLLCRSKVYLTMYKSFAIFINICRIKIGMILGSIVTIKSGLPQFGITCTSLRRKYTINWTVIEHHHSGSHSSAQAILELITL